MIGINMKYKCCELYSDNNIFWNNNPVNNPVSITLNRPVGCKPLTEIILDDIEDIDARESITINGSIMQINRRTQEKTPLSSAIIKVYLNDMDLLGITSNNQGGFEDTYILDTADDYTLKGNGYNVTLGENGSITGQQKNIYINGEYVEDSTSSNTGGEDSQP